MPSENDLDASSATTPRQSLRIAIFVCFLNAGISTRGLEIAKALRAFHNDEDDCHDGIDIRFFSWKGPGSITYDHLVSDEDFGVSYYGPFVDERTWGQLLEYEHAGQSGDRLLPQGLRDRALANLQGALKVLDEFRPDVVVHGLLPDAPVAAQIRGIPNIFYMPIPFWKRQQLQQQQSRQDTATTTGSTNTNTNAKDRGDLEASHKPLYSSLSKSPFLEAALTCGWQPTPTHTATITSDLSDTIYRSDFYLILDLPSHYADYDDLGGGASNNVQIVGPLFANPKDNDQVLPSDIKRVLTEPGKKVFLTLGSSGGKEFVVRAVQAICEGNWNAVVALAPSRCTIQDVCRSIKHIPDCVILTQDFVPAKLIASMVDVVVAHGGQGTVQNALAAGTPIVGVAMQWEQEFNLDQAVKNGAAIRIPKESWTVNTIRQSVTEVLETDSYQRSARRLQQEILALQKDDNSAQKASKLILSIAKENRSKKHQADAHGQSTGA
jgi:hypothetical protein